MKKTTPVLFVLASFAFATGASAADYKIDPSHSHVGFTIKHLIGKVKGAFNDFDGAFSFDPAKATDASGKFTIKTASINTDNAKRDEHLKSGDFFDVQKFPEMTLDKVKVKAGKGKDKFKLTGDLTLHGVTKPVTFDLEYAGTEKDPWGNMRAGFTATTKLNRKDYGVVWNKTLDSGGLMLGDDVAVELNIEAVESKPADAAAAPAADAKKSQ